MSEKIKRGRQTVGYFLVGGKVYVRFGKKKRLARIVEDRGTIGQGGRRLLRVAFTRANGEITQVFEIPAAEVARVPVRARAPRSTRAKAHT